MDGKIGKLVMVTWLIILLVSLLIFLTSPAFAQGPGCEGAAAEFEVLAVHPLASAIPETVSANSRPVGVFYQNRVTFTFEPGPGRRVLLSSSEDGSGCLRTDDWVEIRSSSGRVFNHDYRAPTRDEVWGIGLAVDVTYLFDPGEQEVVITLKDLTGPAHSSRPYYLLVVYDPTPPTATPTASPTPSPLPTSTPTPTPTATPTPVKPVVVVSTSEPAPTAEEGPLPGLPGARWLVLSAVGLLGLAGIGWAICQVKKAGLSGELDIYQNERYLKTVSLAQVGKPEVTVGAGPGADILLAGEGTPEVAIKIYSQKVDGRVQVMIAQGDPGGGGMADGQPLRHEDVYYVGEFKLVYKNYAEETYLNMQEVYRA